MGAHVEPVGQKVHSWKEAEAWDVDQHRRLTPEERWAAGRSLRERVWGEHCPDLRELAIGEVRYRPPR